MKLLFKLRSLTLLAIIIMVAGCSQIYDDAKVSCTSEQPVTIVASIDNANVRTGVPTRAEGNVEDDGNAGWKPEEVKSLYFERTVNQVFLFVYKIGEDEPYKVFFYYTGATSPLSKSPNLDVRKLNIELGSPTSFAMDLELLSGYYNFVLLVNSEAALKEMMDNKTIEHPEKLVEDTQIRTADDVRGSSRKYFPMVGQSELFVPYSSQGTSNTNRVQLNPSIKLERVHACVEFILDTIDKKGGLFFSPILAQTKVTGLKLLNEQNRYTVMPSDDDYTVTGRNSSSPIRAESLKANNPLTPKRDTDYTKGIHYADATGYLKPFYNRLLPHVSESDLEKIYTYVAPATWATTIKDCLTIEFSVRFPGDTEDTVYKIPLTNPGVEGKAQFVTRRNTVYRVRAKLKGREISVVDYEVIDWTNQNVDIPW